MKKHFVIGVLLAAFAAFGAEDDAYTANRKWVREQLTALRQQMGLSTATVETQVSDGGATTYIVSSPFTSAAHPDCVAVCFSTHPCELTAVEPVRLRGLLRAAPEGTEYTITVTMSTGYWTDIFGQKHYFNFGGEGLKLEFNQKLPAMPSTEHTCDRDSDCICKGYGLGVDDIEIPDEYKDISKDEKKAMLDMNNWLENANWPIEVEEDDGDSYYYITDDNNASWDLVNELTKSDAWIDALSQALVNANNYLLDCQAAYCMSQICKEANPKHSWQETTCGPYSWRICSRNSAHKDGTEQHDEHDTGKVAKAGNTGWTQRVYCSCGRRNFEINHDCKHVNCAPCSAGDDCNWPCPTCNGNHDFPYVATGDKCARCGCDGCGQTESAALGTHSEGLHAGWHCCGYKDGDDDLSNGDHCECECGDFKHPNDGHDREVKDPPEYRQIDGNDERHYIINMTECSRCGDPYGILEGHAWLSDETGAPGYKWLDNEKCAEKDECVDCGYEKVQSAEDAGGHLPDGDPMRYENVDDATCRRWYICENCDGIYYDDEHGHSLGSEPVRHENVSSEICRAVFECEHDCGYEEADDTGGHEEGEPIGYECVSDSVCRMKWLCANGCGYEGYTNGSHSRGPDCVCENCHTYEFEHSFKPDDPCGNESCEFCGEPKPNTSPTHSGWISKGTGGHTCACGRVTEGHAMAQTGLSQSDMGWTITLTCSKCGFVETRSHTHHFTNCGTCDAGDNCTVPCTGCKGSHKFGTRTNYSCAKCECSTCPDCDARPNDIGLHTGWAPCSEDVEADNYDGTASGGHCQCACLFYGHNAGTGHDYQRVSGASEYTPYDEQSHLHLVGRCSRCGKLRKEKDPHSIPSEPIRYGTGSEEHCPAIYECTQCKYELELDHGGHDFDAGTPRIETYGGATHIITTFTCIHCGYSYEDDRERECVHRDVILDGNGEITGFGDWLYVNCVCTSCSSNRNHRFTKLIEEPGKCAMLGCDYNDGTSCDATTNTIQGAHVGWSYIDDSLHECACGLRRDGHAIEFVTNTTYACVIDEICGGSSATNGCGHVFGSTHNADMVYCGPNAFCSICKRKRAVGEGGETVWVEGGETDHCWDGQPADVRTKCVCDCGLEVMHYFAEDRTTCGCECGETFSHIRGSDPTCKCTGEPSHAKVLIGHGTTTRTVEDISRICPSPCGKTYTDKKYIDTCDICGEVAKTQVVPGSHECVLGYTVTAGELTYTIAGYTWPDPITGEDKEVEAVNETVSWSGGGFGCAPADGNRVPAAGTITAGGATILIRSSGTYWLRAKIDDSGSVSVGGLTASGPYWAFGAPVSGYLGAGTVSVSAGVSSVGGPCSFEYELSGPSENKPEGW